MRLERSVNGAMAGAAAATAWAAQQPLDKAVLGTRYDDVELLGKLVTRGRAWPAAGMAMHAANGALFGALYVQIKPFLPGPAVARAVFLSMAENFAGWTLVGVTDRLHPARKDLEPLRGNNRALAQATWRHLLFGVVLGVLEERLNARSKADEPPPVPASSNGHGSIELAAETV